MDRLNRLSIIPLLNNQYPAKSSNITPRVKLSQPLYLVDIHRRLLSPLDPQHDAGHIIPLWLAARELLRRVEIERALSTQHSESPLSSSKISSAIKCPSTCRAANSAAHRAAAVTCSPRCKR